MINCVHHEYQNYFESNGIRYLGLNMRDNLDQSLEASISLALQFIEKAIEAEAKVGK